MATNRFQGVIATEKERNEATFNGLYAGVVNDIHLRGECSEAGAGTDFGMAEDYSSTATFGCWIATSNCVVNRMTWKFIDGSIDETADMSELLFVGGAAALTNGIDFQVRDTNDTVLFSLDPVKSISMFALELGAVYHRTLSGFSTTDANNSDNLIVTMDFEKIFGAGIRLRETDKIGFYLNDDFSGLAAVEGTVFGHKLFL